MPRPQDGAPHATVARRLAGAALPLVLAAPPAAGQAPPAAASEAGFGEEPGRRAQDPSAVACRPLGGGGFRRLVSNDESQSARRATHRDGVLRGDAADWPPQTLLQAIPPPQAGAKAEGVAVLGAGGGTLRPLVLHEDPRRGGARELRLPPAPR